MRNATNRYFPISSITLEMTGSILLPMLCSANLLGFSKARIIRQGATTCKYNAPFSITTDSVEPDNSRTIHGARGTVKSVMPAVSTAPHK